MIDQTIVQKGSGSHVGKPRNELKYVVPASLLSELRFFAQPFCVPDPEAKSTDGVPEYRITTLQLDTRDRSLHVAKERELLNRFKLRVRSYGEIGTQAEFLEIKRKLEDLVIKTRCKLPAGTFEHDFVLGDAAPKGLGQRDEQTYWEFTRLVTQLDARPAILIRYTRESWVGLHDKSQRITFDRALEYSITDQWNLTATKDWRPMDSATAFQLPYAPMILEMKCSTSMPRWMQRLIHFFSLSRTGFCKYSTAMRLESLFEGSTYSQTSENTSYS